MRYKHHFNTDQYSVIVLGPTVYFNFTWGIRQVGNQNTPTCTHVHDIVGYWGDDRGCSQSCKQRITTTGHSRGHNRSCRGSHSRLEGCCAIFKFVQYYSSDCALLIYGLVVVNGQRLADHYELPVSEFAIARQRDSGEY